MRDRLSSEERTGRGRDIVRWTAKETERYIVQRKREKAMTNIECVHPALRARVMNVRKRKRKKGQEREEDNFSSQEQVSFNFMAAITICNDSGA